MLGELGENGELKKLDWPRDDMIGSPEFNSTKLDKTDSHDIENDEVRSMFLT